jgi:hypothetical protein
MAQKMDVEEQMMAVPISGEAQVSRQYQDTSSSSGYGPVTVSRTLLVERQVVHEQREDTPTKLLLQHAASQAQHVAIQQSQRADQAENLAQHLQSQGEARIAEIIAEAQRVLAAERGQTREKFDAAVSEVNLRCAEILAGERAQLQSREDNMRRYVETGELEKQQYKEQMETLQSVHHHKEQQLASLQQQLISAQT